MTSEMDKVFDEMFALGDRFPKLTKDDYRAYCLLRIANQLQYIHMDLDRIDSTLLMISGRVT